jgi:hypothetical protein
MPTTTILAVDTAQLERILGLTRAARTVPMLHHRILSWHDAWRGSDRTLRWQGACLGCGRQTWAFDDGENDPRGILGDAALCTVDVPGWPDETEARACAVCANDYETYRAIQHVAVALGSVKAAPLNFGAQS